MKIYILVASSIALAISACAPNRVPVDRQPSASQPIQPSPTASATPEITDTATRSVTPTFVPETATRTPLPTIPTFTPTFDARSAVTATPAPKAICPEENPALVADFLIPTANCMDTNTCMFTGTEQDILKFLNRGGPMKSVLARLSTAIHGYYNGYFYQDVTGDGVPDLIFVDFGVLPMLHVLVCNSGKYDLFTLSGPSTTHILALEDMNADGIPEIVVEFSGCSGSGCFGISAFEWNGKDFQDLTDGVGMDGLRDVKIQDLDHNGTKEIVLTGDVPGHGSVILMLPWRLKTDVYSWNGQAIALASESFAPPQYRYQAIQDADRLVLSGKYDQALALYQDAIFSDKLDWWSAERREYEYENSSYATPVTPYPTPAPDTTEYPKLAAYAYYRILILRVKQGYETDGGVLYTTLQRKFPTGDPGFPYVEMATAFWVTYRSSHDLTAACGAAIEYAAEHPEILQPLSGGSIQDHNYMPANVCPFR